MHLKHTTDNPWLSQPYHEGLVNIGTHSLSASISGPIRKTTNDPIVVFITGAGGPCALYVKLQQQLSSFVRVLFCDRAGYNLSTLPQVDPAAKIYATATALDLTKFLATTQLEPPYILVAHSYGGIVARSFLELHKDNPQVIVGMLLFDCATELMLQLFSRVPPLELVSIGRNVDVEALTDLKRQSGMTDAEWDYAIVAVQRCTAALKREDTHASAYQLALYNQFDTQAFGARPLKVIQCNMTKDYQFLYDAGVENGDGTEEERKVARTFIEMFGMYHGQIARAQCGLSRNVVFKYFDEWSHDLPFRRPAMAAEEIRKLLDRARGSS